MILVWLTFYTSSCYLTSWHSKMTYHTGGRERPWLGCQQEWVSDDTELGLNDCSIKSIKGLF